MKDIILENSKFALLSDMHWGINNNSDIKIDIFTNYMDWYIQTLKENDVQDVIFLGDWFDNRSVLSVKTMNVVHLMLKKLLENKIKLYLIVGNHDIYYKDNLAVNSINIFEEIDNVTVISEPTKFYETITGKSIFAFPWNTYSGKHGKCDLMLGHFNFQGAKLVGTVNKSGETIEALLKTSPLVFSGHFHIRHEYKRNGGKLITVGNPVQQTWGDYGNQKGIYIFDLNTMDYDFIENTISPTYQRVYFSKFRDKLENLKNINGNFVEFVVDDDYKFEIIMKIIKLINSKNPLMNCKVDYVFNKTRSSLEEMTFDENSDILKMTKYEYMLQYIDHNKDEMKENEIDLNILSTMIKDYYDISIDKKGDK